MRTLIHTLFFFLLVTQISLGQGTWTKIGDMPEIRYIHTADEIYGKVYIAGGLNTEQGAYPTTMLVYDKAAGTWSSIPLPGNSVRGRHTSCVVDSNLYLIGGGIVVGSTINSTSEMYMFKPSTNEWILKNPMPTDRANLACAFLDGKIYVAGGMRVINGVINYDGLKTFEVYDIVTETWSTLPDMPTYRWGLSVVAFDSKIYVFGGRGVWNRPASVDVYDPQDSSWTSVTNMPTPRYKLAVCVMDSNIYAIDGWYSSGSGPIYDTVEVYNPITDVWTTGTSMPVSVAALDGYAIDGKIYMYGGSCTTHPNIGISDIWEFTPSPVSVENGVSAPIEFTLEQNYPNPFNPSTVISYQLPVGGNAAIKVYDILGNEIATLVDEYKPVGKYEVEFNASRLASGIYFYELKAGDFLQTRKMILIK
jgi:N-acetylneuraminic acid mutarotase